MTIMRVGVKSSIFEGTCVSIKALVTYIKLILSTGLRALKCITDHIRRVTGQKLGDINKYIYIYRSQDFALFAQWLDLKIVIRYYGGCDKLIIISTIRTCSLHIGIYGG